MVTAGSDADVMAANELAAHVILQVRIMLCIFERRKKNSHVFKNPKHARSWSASVERKRERKQVLCHLQVHLEH
jgi:hypothetical protein